MTQRQSCHDRRMCTFLKLQRRPARENQQSNNNHLCVTTLLLLVYAGLFNVDRPVT